MSDVENNEKKKETEKLGRRLDTETEGLQNVD